MKEKTEMAAGNRQATVLYCKQRHTQGWITSKVEQKESNLLTRQLEILESVSQPP